MKLWLFSSKKWSVKSTIFDWKLIYTLILHRFSHENSDFYNYKIEMNQTILRSYNKNCVAGDIPGLDGHS